ncbi:MAG: enoyl-CoA hydratase/isomerase family protein [Candidatus Rokubacteria bacterium]|nr:enoyl-CoA hydratase/isomerase family protein [Candidatus Rokubacteria bacterium]
MAELEALRWERDGSIFDLVLNRPAQLNAINRQMLLDLAAVCDTVERDASLKVVTLTGEGRAFCAGADLRTVREVATDPQKWEEFIRLWHRVFNRIEALPIPVIAGVHGMALAGGLELTMVADLVIADEDAKLGDQHANFGLVAGGGGTQRLPRLIGLRRAKELMLRGQWLSAREALEWGLINRVVSTGRLRESVREMAGQLATLSGSANRTVKMLANRGMDLALGDGLELEIRAVEEHMRSADCREGLSAFLEKRKPKFS